ncbi:hypothetical protein [Chamaesiphon polymorphus]|uniref:hypothetical protein n=1 Tax=Chamaesiphon polymorphus TaxID=2107691 RepID=UPI0015E7D2AA|nr:hypothetical protein [Chamaesiphon polymorphus]
MTEGSLSPQQQAKLAEALELAKLAEEKARQMSELATSVANKYQQYLYDSANSPSKQAS